MPLKEKQNKEGLTFKEWIYAAGYMPELRTIELYCAWLNSEDPSEYRKDMKRNTIKMPPLVDCGCALDSGFNPLAYMCPKHKPEYKLF